MFPLQSYCIASHITLCRSQWSALSLTTHSMPFYGIDSFSKQDLITVQTPILKLTHGSPIVVEVYIFFLGSMRTLLVDIEAWNVDKSLWALCPLVHCKDHHGCPCLALGRLLPTISPSIADILTNPCFLIFLTVAFRYPKSSCTYIPIIINV